MGEESLGSGHEAWARFRFAVVGGLLASPPPAGELSAKLLEMSRRLWRHPISGAAVRFGVSTIERWYYAARGERRDPVSALRRRVRRDAGTQPSVSGALSDAIRAQWKEHRRWSYQLHYDNLLALEQRERLGEVPSYATVRRFMRAHGLVKQRRPPAWRQRLTEGALRAAERLETLEVRSFEAEYVHGLWHLDFHQGSRHVLVPSGEWAAAHMLAILDDRSRLACHVQWYLDESAESLVHGLSQAIEKRALPRALMHDNGPAMIAAETQQGLSDLGIQAEPTLPYSPYQNGKQENFFATVEGRLLAMLEGCTELRLDLLNEATQAWAELDYNRHPHSELGQKTPLERYLADNDVGRPSPSSEDLRRAFRARLCRTQRKSDGTVSVLGRRFEVPSRYRHLERVVLRVAGWDLGSVDLVDPRSGKILCALYPLDKTANADGRRRRLETGAAPGEPAAPPRASSAIAPLLKKLMADYAATGLPPAYIPKPPPTTSQGTDGARARREGIADNPNVEDYP